MNNVNIDYMLKLFGLTQNNCTKKIFKTQIIMMVLSLTQSQTSWNMNSRVP